MFIYPIHSWSQWTRGLRRRSLAVRLLRSWVRIPPGAWMFVCCECCALSSRGLCDGFITHPEESHRLARRRVWSRNLENEEAKALYRAVKIQPQWVVTPGKQTNKQTYPIYNHNWKNISTFYTYNKTRIKWNILIIKQNISGSRSG